MSLDVTQRAEANRRRRLWLLLVGGLAAALFVTSGVAFLAGGRRGDNTGPTRPAATPGGAATTQPSSAPVPTPADRVVKAAGAWVPPARQVKLPAGSDQIEELPVGFPHTPEGAAAAEVAKDRYSSTLDYRLANTVARVYFAPPLTATADQASTAAVRALRAKLGVDEGGPVPTDVSAVARPLGVQWSDDGDGRTAVSVLVQVDYRRSDRAWSELAASTTVWQWMAGEAGRPADWRLVDARRPSAALAPIGTKAFNDEGWAAIVTETAR